MTEISTRVWLDEELWDQVRARALAEGTTVRDLMPQLVSQGLAGAPPAASPSAAPAAPADAPAAPAAENAPAEPGPPVIPLSEVYRCGVCGIQFRLSGLSNHMGRHLKEQQALEEERS